MVQFVNEFISGDRLREKENATAGTSSLARTQVQCKNLIVSGGLQNFLDGYYLTEMSALPAVYGQASAFLRYSREDYATLKRYVLTQVRGLELARAYLRPRL
jgi:isopentenyl-diphosphate delta-isomerase